MMTSYGFEAGAFVESCPMLTIGVTPEQRKSGGIAGRWRNIRRKQDANLI
jgi:hypothetical protein